MTIPVWVMLGFAGWTLAVLTGGIGLYRWSQIVAGRATVSQWHPGVTQGSERYQRAMRAHMNCVENLPVYGAVAVAAALAGVGGRDLDALSVTVLLARVAQSLVHIARPQTDRVAAVRFGLYCVQVISIVAMAVLLVIRA
jgi:uncharacterized MAPEG superfamily protein